MKKTMLALIALVAFAGSAFAAEATYTYPGGSFGKVTFPHQKHMKLGCAKCHQGAPKKIAINMDVAHNQLCVKCHKAMGQGPTSCKDCHKK